MKGRMYCDSRMAEAVHTSFLYVMDFVWQCQLQL